MRFLLFDGIKVSIDCIESVGIIPKNVLSFDHQIILICMHNTNDKNIRFKATERFGRETQMLERYKEIKAILNNQINLFEK